MLFFLLPTGASTGQNTHRSFQKRTEQTVSKAHKLKKRSTVTLSMKTTSTVHYNAFIILYDYIHKHTMLPDALHTINHKTLKDVINNEAD